MKSNRELRCGFTVLAAAASAVLSAPLVAFGEEAAFEVALSGPEASGDSDGQGTATVTMNAETNAVDVRLSYSSIARPTLMLIREGALGTQGNVVMPIVIDSGGNGMSVGHRTSAKPNLVKTILASPEEYYLVVVNDEYPIGALRGPLKE